MSTTVNNAANAAANAVANAVSGSSSSSSSSGSSTIPTGSAAQNGLNTNYQDFLKLLTTQLQNQDPTAPADTNQITQEIASLSQVEQQINTNSNLQQLISLLSTGQNNAAVSYIGKQVDTTGNQTSLKGGQATLVYNLPAGTSSATLTITNAAGQKIFSGPGTTLAGRNQMQWGGSTTSGTTAADGTYTFSIAATDSSGKALTATTMTTGTVAAVETANGVSTLSLGGGLTVPVNGVQAVYNAGTNPT